MIQAVSEGLPQNFALVGTACTLILGGFFWLLKYFFQKDAANTALRFEEFKADFNKVVDRLDAEIRGVDRRLQAVELEQVRNYVLRRTSRTPSLG